MKVLRAHVYPIVALLGTTIAVLFHAPGGMSPDSVFQLSQGRKGVYEDSHPPLMAVVWGWVDALCPGPLGMMIMQTAMIGLAIFIVLKLFPALPNGLRALVFLVVLFWPGHFFLLGVVWKDIATLGAFSLALAVVVRCLANPRDALADWGLVIVVLLLIFYGIAVRLNAVTAAMPIVALLFWQWLPHYTWLPRLAIAASAGVLLSIILFAASLAMNDSIVSKHNHYWQMLAVYDLAGISVRVDENLMPTQIYPRANLPLLKKFYTNRSLIPLTWSSKAFPRLERQNQLRLLRQRWLWAVVAHPFAYLAHRADITSQVVGLTWNEPWVAVYLQGVVPNDLGIPSATAPWRDAVMALAKQYSINSLMFRPWIYLIVCSITLGMAIVLRLQCAPVLVTLSTSSILTFIGLFYSAPSSDYRYSISIVFNTVLACACIACELSSGEIIRDCVARLGRRRARAVPSAGHVCKPYAANLVSLRRFRRLCERRRASR